MLCMLPIEHVPLISAYIEHWPLTIHSFGAEQQSVAVGYRARVGCMPIATTQVKLLAPALPVLSLVYLTLVLSVALSSLL
jgi:hypothetical protein